MAKQKRQSYTIDCGLCGESVTMDRRRYLAHIRAGTLPFCRRNGCHRYERRGGVALLVAARVSEGVADTHVAGKVFQNGSGQRGHQEAPLANGRVRRVRVTGYVGAVEADD